MHSFRDMKTMVIIVPLLLAGLMLSPFIDSAPVDSTTGAVTIIRNEFIWNDDGGYKFGYETSDGQRRDEEGKWMTDSDGIRYLYVEGSYSYVGPDGETYDGYYEADKDGYRFKPVPPPIGISNNVLLSLVG